MGTLGVNAIVVCNYKEWIHIGGMQEVSYNGDRFYQTFLSIRQSDFMCRFTSKMVDYVGCQLSPNVSFCHFQKDSDEWTFDGLTIQTQVYRPLKTIHLLFYPMRLSKHNTRLTDAMGLRVSDYGLGINAQCKWAIHDLEPLMLFRRSLDVTR